MNSPRYKRIVVKVGTNVITREDGFLDQQVIHSLVLQVAQLMQQDVQVVLVTSGAVAAGRAVVKPSRELSRISSRQVLSAVGQIKLIHMYERLFANEHITAAQVLATKEDFRDREHYLNMRKCLEALVGEGIVPVVNENDSVSITELMFTDNDELAGLIATMLDVDALIILTNVQGIYTGDPQDPTCDLLPEIDGSTNEWRQYLKAEKSTFGRGGVHTKCETALKAASLGIPTHIASGKIEGNLLRLMAGEKVGTVFPAKRSTSSVKRWMASSEGRANANGRVTLNDCAVEILSNKEQAVSLLPIGITGIEGDFQKGDLIKVCNSEGKGIGVGIARYDAAQAREAMGQKNQKPLIHYDYLYLY